MQWAVEPPDMEVRMDPSQLQQVLWNLCDNAIRYSRGTPLVELRGGIRDQTQRPYLDVIDHGPGMSAEVAEHLFEPFMTTEMNGSGLGLYIARELCEANQAALSLHRNSVDGCQFRISFPYPVRQELPA
jgi:two-component system sensor histidine kinase PilS (NtrC family)